MDPVLDDNGVLYEVVISADWDPAAETTTTADRSAAEATPGTAGDSVVSRPIFARLLFPILWIYYWIAWIISESIARFSVPDLLVTWQSSAIPWKLATVRPVTDDGIVTDHVIAAVFTEDAVEIRRSTDEFATSREKFSLTKDGLAMLRQASWSRSGRYLALAECRGDLTLFDCLSAESTLIKVSEPWTEASRLLRHRVVSNILWIDSPDGDEDLLLFYADGRVNCFHRKESILSQEWSVNCKTSLPGLMKAISCAAYSHRQNLLIIASTINGKVDEDLNDPWLAGLTTWIPGDEPPYLRLASEEELTEAKSARHLYKKLAKAKDGVVKMAVNNAETELVTLFLSGAVGVWQLSFRAIKFRRIWTVDQLPQYNTSQVPATRSRSPRDKKNPNFPADVQWWSDTAIILSQTGGAVSLLDVTGRQLVNVAHGSFEQFSPGCLITPNLAEKFLILEQNMPGKVWMRSTSHDDIGATGDDSVVSEDDDNAVSVMSEVLQSFGMSGEKSPANLPKKLVGPSYRLNCFQTASPQEMFQRKLVEEQYGEALLLAERFHLDADLVYQKRWMKSKVTKNTIADFLCKVSNKSWVLRECLTRVPTHPDVARELLMVGLRLTDRTSIVRLNPDCCGDTIEKTDDRKLPFDIDVSKLTPEQHAMIGHRRQLLRFESLLSIYEQILGGGEKAVRYFMADEYADLRRKSSLEIALLYAHHCKPEDLHTLRYLRYDDLSQYWLDILANFPETFSPESYQFLLPSVLNGEIVETQHAAPISLDWSLQESFGSVTDLESATTEKDLESLQATLPYKGALSVKKMQKWTESRVVEIEQRSGLIENARQLLQVAQAKRIQGLDSLKDELDTLTVLVYEADQTAMSLADMRKLDPRQMLKLLSDKIKESFPVVFRARMLPYLRRCERKSPGLQYSLLEEYMSEMVVDQQTLDKCLKVFQQSLPGLPEPAIPSPSEAVDMAVKCILGCPRTDQLEQMKAILECLPSREAFPALSKIHDLIMCVEFAERFGVRLSVKNASEVQANEGLVVEFVSHLLQVAVQKVLNFTELEWKDIYGQYIRICKRVFTSLGDTKMVELFANALLSSGKNQYIDLAAKFLTVVPKPTSITPKLTPTEVWTVPNRLSASTSSKLLLAAGKEYFASSDTWKDARVRLAEKCFDLASGLGNGDAKVEMGLVDALKVLHAMGVDASPLDLWTSADRFKFVKQLLDEKSDAYKHPDRLRDLAALLAIGDVNRVTEAVAEKAFEKRDFGFCRDLCEKLIEEKRPSSWELCAKLAAAADFSDMAFKDKILLFAVTHSPDDRLVEVVTLQNRVKISNMKTQLRPGESPPVEPLASLSLDSCFIPVDHSRLVKSVPLHAMSDSLDELVTSSGWLTHNVLSVLTNGDRNLPTTDCDAYLVNAAVAFLSVDAGLALSSLGALSDKSSAERFFDLLPLTPVISQLAAYFYGLEIYSSNCNSTDMDKCLSLSCKDVISRATEMPSPDGRTSRIHDLLKKYSMNHSSRTALKSDVSSPVTPAALPSPPTDHPKAATPSRTSSQAPTRSVRAVLKGVDETKFQTSPEYRKSFLLRAAATKDSAFLHELVKLAQEYGVDSWEVVAAGIKYLFTTSGLSLEQVEAFLKQIPDLIDLLRKRKTDFLRFSGLQIQPYMTNVDMFLLEAYSDFLTDIKKA